MIDITAEKLLPLSKAAQLLPARRKGKRPHPATLYRWAAKGIGDVKLEVVRIGCTTCTSVEALQRFFDRLGYVCTQNGQPGPASLGRLGRRAGSTCSGHRLARDGGAAEIAALNIGDQTMEALNPKLYRAMKRTFRQVEIVNHGQRACVTHRHEFGPGGRIRIKIEATRGEYYRANCPFCRDTRKRLWISYLWGEMDPKTGKKMMHLATCFNEECIDCWERQERLYELIYASVRARRLRGMPVDLAPEKAQETRSSPVKPELPAGL